MDVTNPMGRIATRLDKLIELQRETIDRIDILIGHAEAHGHAGDMESWPVAEFVTMAGEIVVIKPNDVVKVQRNGDNAELVFEHGSNEISMLVVKDSFEQAILKIADAFNQGERK